MSDKKLSINADLYERDKRIVTAATVANAKNGTSAAAAVSIDDNGTANFDFTFPVGQMGPTGPQGPKGETGEGFSIYKTYSSIVEMNNDLENVPINKFVIVADFYYLV